MIPPNEHSAAPRRRRRPPLPASPAVPPLPPESDAPPPRRTTTLPPRVYRVRSGVMRWPRAVRLALCAMIAVVLAVSGVAITRHYLTVQEQRRIAQEEAALKARHPLYYAEWIQAAAAENSLNPALLSAVILCESSFDPQAESYLGARGLMQLMEPTAQWVAEKLDVSGYTFDMMYDPETNIRFGAWYLGYLARRFDGNALNVVCAYHAGQGNVDAWLSNPLYSEDGVTLLTIPTDDTAKYAKRVLSAYEVYQKFYFLPEDAGADAGADADADAGAAG